MTSAMQATMERQPAGLRGLFQDTAGIAALASRLQGKRRILVIGTTSWHAANQGARFLQLAGLDARAVASVDLAVVTDRRTQDTVDNQSTSFAGWLGYGRNDASAKLLDSADLVCFIGCGNADVLSDGYRLGARDRRTVVVDADPSLRTHYGAADLHVLAAPAGFVSVVQQMHPEHPVASWHGWWLDAHKQQERFARPSRDGATWGVDLAVAMAQ